MTLHRLHVTAVDGDELKIALDRFTARELGLHEGAELLATVQRGQLVMQVVTPDVRCTLDAWNDSKDDYEEAMKLLGPE